MTWPLGETSLQPTDWTKIPTLADGYDGAKWKTRVPGPELLNDVHPRLLELFEADMLPRSLPVGLFQFVDESRAERVHSWCQVSPDGRYLEVISASQDSIEFLTEGSFQWPWVVRYYDLAEGNSVVAEWEFTTFPESDDNQVRFRGHPEFIDGYRLIREGESGFELWNLREQTQSHVIGEASVIRYSSLLYNSPLMIANGDRLIVGEKRGDVGSGVSFFDLDSSHLEPTSMSFGPGLSILKDSPSGARLLLSGENQAFQIYDVETESLVSNLEHGRVHPNGWFSDDERTVLIQSAGQYSFWHVDAGRKLVRLQGIPTREEDLKNSLEEFFFPPDKDQIFLRRDHKGGTDLYVLDLPTVEEIDDEIGKHFQ